MKNSIKRYILPLAALLLPFSLAAQSSLPAPGSGGGPGGGGFGGPGFGGNSLPAPGAGGGYRPNPGPGPGVPPPASWGSPWNGPSFSVNVNVNSPNWTNSGTMTVMACGYDSSGIWRTIPLRVSYSWNGVQYNVVVLNAWNPWSDMWMRGINTQAYNTSYYTHGNTYNFYVPLSTGTYYFNL